jgi:hypothetical protein
MNKTAGLATATLGSLLSEVTIGSGSKPKPKPDKDKIEPKINVQFGEDMTPEEIEFVLKGLGLSGPGLVSVREALQKSAAPNLPKLFSALKRYGSKGMSFARDSKAWGGAKLKGSKAWGGAKLKGALASKPVRGLKRVYGIHPSVSAARDSAEQGLEAIKQRLAQAHAFKANPVPTQAMLDQLAPKPVHLDKMKDRLDQYLSSSDRVLPPRNQDKLRSAFNALIRKNDFSTAQAERIRGALDRAINTPGAARLDKLDEIKDSLGRLVPRFDSVKVQEQANRMAKQLADRDVTALNSQMTDYISNNWGPATVNFNKAKAKSIRRIAGTTLGAGLGAVGVNKLLTKDSEFNKQAAIPLLAVLPAGLKLLGGFLARKGLTMGARRLLTGFGRKALMGFGRKALTTGARNIGTKAMATGARRLGTQAVSSGAKNMATKGLGQRLAGYGRRALDYSMYLPTPGAQNQQLSDGNPRYNPAYGLGKYGKADDMLKLAAGLRNLAGPGTALIRYVRPALATVSKKAPIPRKFNIRDWLKRNKTMVGLGALMGIRGSTSGEDPLLDIHRHRNVFNTEVGRQYYGQMLNR